MPPALIRPVAFALLALCAACGSESEAHAHSADAGARFEDGPEEVDAGPVDAGARDGGAADAGPIDAGSPPWWTARERDGDGDYWDKEDGDCDDTDPSVHPENEDLCDGRDEDCDGRIDEDFDGDRGEPANDAPRDLGDLTYSTGALVDQWLFPASDVDRFRFRVDDVLLRDFDIEAWVYGVPPDADFVVELRLVSGGEDMPAGTIQIADEAGAGGYEYVNYSGDISRDDSGVYEVVVRSKSGATCAYPYQLQILVGGV